MSIIEPIIAQLHREASREVPFTVKHDKDHYRAIRIAGYFWGGFDSDRGLHMFARKVLQSWQPVDGDPRVSKLVRDDQNGWWHGTWENCLVTEEDLDDGSAEWMMKRGYTRAVI